MQKMEQFPRENSTFLLPAPAGQLEVMTTFPSDTPQGVGIICHPDPRFGGAMHNKVVTTVARALLNLGFATVRFNYRGVGRSSGEYGHTHGELVDLETVIVWVREVLPSQPLWLAGFSFGSYISARAAQLLRPARLISIAPPVNHYDFHSFTGMDFPWLVIQGDEDEVVPFQEVKTWAEHPPSPLTLSIMPNASHFFHGRLIELRELIIKWAQGEDRRSPIKSTERH